MCAVYRCRDSEETAANDDLEQVSTVKRRSASGDGVDALNTRVTDANLGEAAVSKQRLPKRQSEVVEIQKLCLKRITS